MREHDRQRDDKGHDDSYALKNGHPPSASKTVCVDLDRTIIPWGSLEEVRAPITGVVEGLTYLRNAGFRIVILTSRMSEVWWRAEAEARGINWMDFGTEQRRIVRRILDEGGVPYDKITAEKEPAVAYFDDRAIRVDETYTLYEAVLDFLDGIFGR